MTDGNALDVKLLLVNVNVLDVHPMKRSMSLRFQFEFQPVNLACLQASWIQILRI